MGSLLDRFEQKIGQAGALDEEVNPPAARPQGIPVVDVPGRGRQSALRDVATLSPDEERASLASETRPANLEQWQRAIESARTPEERKALQDGLQQTLDRARTVAEQPPGGALLEPGKDRSSSNKLFDRFESRIAELPADEPPIAPPKEQGPIGKAVDAAMDWAGSMLRPKEGTPERAAQDKRVAAAKNRRFDTSNERTRKMIERDRIGGTAIELQQRAQADKANETAAKDTWRNLGGYLQTLDPIVRGVIGGLARWAGERALSLRGGEDDPGTLGPDLAEELAAFGKDAVASADEDSKAAMKGLTPGEGAKAVGSAVQSLATMGLPLLAGIVTGGTSTVLSGIGLMTFGKSYGQGRQEGLSPNQSSVYAALQTTIEVGTEFLPVKALMARNPGAAQWFWNFLVREVPTEMLATTLQDALDKVSVQPEMTFQDFADDFLTTVLSTPLAAGAQAGAAHALRPPMKEGELSDDQKERIMERFKEGMAKVAEAQKTAKPTSAASHTLEDGTRVRPRLEGGQPVPGVWETDEGEVVEAKRAEPVKTPEPNAAWKVGGVEYEVEVTGKGRGPKTARLADGQEVPLGELASLGDEAKARLGMDVEGVSKPTQKAAPAGKTPSKSTQRPAAAPAEPAAPVAAAAPAAAPPAAPAAPQQPRTMPEGPAPKLEGTRALQRQNRLREGAASVAQMNQIANQPDYDRLSVSKAPETGAPMVSIAGDDAQALDRRQFGKEGIVVVGGQKVPVAYAVIEADQLIASHKVDGTQVAGYFGDPTPGQVRALNNGRAAGLKEAYDRKTIEDYRTALRNDKDHGIARTVIDQMKRPVLVRVYPDEFNTSIQNIGEASQGETLEQSPLELALQDAAKMGNIEGFDPGEEGDIASAGNADFVKRFIQSIVPEPQRGRLFDPTTGKPNKLAYDRIEAAVFQKAYSSPQLTGIFAEAADPEIRLIINALSIAAPEMGKLEGAPELLDIRPYVAEAAKLAVMAKRASTKLDTYLKQTDIERNPLVQEMAQIMADHMPSARNKAAGRKTGAKAIGNGLITGAQWVQKVISDEQTADMFGDKPKFSVADALKTINDFMEKEYGQKEGTGLPESDLLSDTQKPGAEQPARSPPAVGADAARGEPPAAGSERTGAEGEAGAVRREAGPKVEQPKAQYKIVHISNNVADHAWTVELNDGRRVILSRPSGSVKLGDRVIGTIKIGQNGLAPEARKAAILELVAKADEAAQQDTDRPDLTLEGETPEQIKAKADAAAAAAKPEPKKPDTTTADQLDLFNTQKSLFQVLAHYDVMPDFVRQQIEAMGADPDTVRVITSREQYIEAQKRYGLPNTLRGESGQVASIFSKWAPTLFVDDDHDGKPVAVFIPQGGPNAKRNERSELRGQGESKAATLERVRDLPGQHGAELPDRSAVEKRGESAGPEGAAPVKTEQPYRPYDLHLGRVVKETTQEWIARLKATHGEGWAARAKMALVEMEHSLSERQLAAKTGERESEEVERRADWSRLTELWSAVFKETGEHQAPPDQLSLFQRRGAYDTSEGSIIEALADIHGQLESGDLTPAKAASAVQRQIIGAPGLMVALRGIPPTDAMLLQAAKRAFESRPVVAPGPRGIVRRIAGFFIRMETLAGEKRRPEWPALKDDYGEMVGVMGMDKDYLDVFVNQDTPAGFGGSVFVVNQLKADDSFDEHKVMMGYPSLAAAREAYQRNYEPGWDRGRSIVRISMSAFREWATSKGRTGVGAGPKGGKLLLSHARRLEEHYQVSEPDRADLPDRTTTAQRDLFATYPIPREAPVPEAREGAVRFEHVVVETVRTGTVKLPAGRITNEIEAAQAFQQLAKSPRERFQLIGLDENENPVAYYDLFSGTITQTAVFPREVLLNLFTTPGVKKVWFSHNHPSGIPEPSDADQELDKRLREGLKGPLGIEAVGHIIIAGNRAVEIGQSALIKPFRIPPVERGWQDVPIMERVIQREDYDDRHESLTSPRAVQSYLRILKPTEDGLLFLDAQNRPIAWYPMPLDEMSQVSLTDIRPMGALLRQISRNNPEAVMAIAHDMPGMKEANVLSFRMRLFERAISRLKDVLRLADVRVLDGFFRTDDGFESMAQRGAAFEPATPYRSLGPAVTGMTQEAALSELMQNPLYRKVGHMVNVIAGPWQLPEGMIQDMTKVQGMATARGVYDHGQIWIIASNNQAGDTERVLVHELIGHYGINGILEKGAGLPLRAAFLEIYNARQADIQRDARSGFLSQYDLDLRNETHRVTAAAEWIARRAERGEEQALWRRIVAAIRNWLRQIGLVREWTDNDILRLLQLSRESLTNRHGMSVNGRPLFALSAGEPSSIQAKPGVSFERLNKLLGAKLYGEPKHIATVSVKEMVQNSFDAVKSLIDSGTVKKGSISIKVDADKRTIEITDDGTGMTPQTLATSFLQLASSNKETDRSSGGLGIAKGLFLYGNQRVRVDTVRDGRRSTLDTTGAELSAAADGSGKPPQIKVSDATNEASGTTVIVDIPKSYVDTASGDTIEIEIPSYPQAYPVLRFSPLFSNIDVRFNGELLKGIGSTFQSDKYSVFARTEFRWGDATIYVSKEKRGADRWGPNAHFLSNGLWQFSTKMLSNPFDAFSKEIPRDLFIDIHPRVRPEDAGYPFDLNRQRFSGQTARDFDNLAAYISMAYRKETYANQAESFGQLRYYKRGILGSPQILRPEAKSDEPGLLRVVEGDTVTIEEGRLIVNGREIPILTKKDVEKATTNIDDYRIPQSDIETGQVMLHDNVRLTSHGGALLSDYMRKNFGDRFDSFISDLGNAFIALRSWMIEHYPTTYGELERYGIGVSFDKDYHGVHILLPFNGVFVNPATLRGLAPEEIGNEVFGTMIHELVHINKRGHDASFINELQLMYSRILSDGEADAIRTSVVDLVKRNEHLLAFMNEEFNGPTTAIGESLKGAESARDPGAVDRPSKRGVGRGAERTDQQAAESRGPLERGEIYTGLSGTGEGDLGPQFALREPRGLSEVYGVRDGRLLGMAVRSSGIGPWDVYLASGTNENLLARGEFRREQAATINEVQRIFNREGLELHVIKPRNIPVPDRAIFDNDWVAPQADNWFRRATIYFQNRLLLPELYESAIAKQVGAIPEAAKVHREARIAHPRAAGKIADFDHEFSEPIVEIMRRNKLSLKDVGLYLYARHAPERNAAIEQINPDNRTGSGISDERAAAVIETFRAAGRLPVLEEIGRIVNDISRYREGVWLDKGLVKQEVIALMQQKYPNYVPLKEIVEDEFAQSQVSAGFGVAQPFSTAFGRYSEAQAEYILPGLIAQAKGTIAAGENAEVLRALLKQVSYAANPEVWRVQKSVWKPYIDRDTGEVRYAPRPVQTDADYSSRAISVPVNGERHIIVVADQRLADAFRSSGLPVGGFSQLIGSVTRFYALMATAANPEFVMVNLMRDFQQAMIRISGEQNPALALKVAKDVPAALWGAFWGLRAKGQLTDDAGTWHKWYRRYIEAGGHIAYRGMVDTETQHKEFLLQLAEAGIYPEAVGRLTATQFRGHRVAKVMGAKYFSQMVIDVNGAVENALRLSAFKNAIEAGWKEKDAAFLARNVTVDFNLRGEAGARIGAYYMFFNANLQGSALLFRSVMNHRAIKLLAVMLFFSGMFNDRLNRWRSRRADDGRSYYDNISASVKERNFVIMGPDRENAVTIPLPFGFNVFYVAGANMMAAIDKAQKPAEAAVNTLVAAVNAFNPFGQSPSSMLGALQLLSPTILDQVVQAMTNRNFMDKPISPERPRFATPQADSATYFSGTPSGYVETAQWLNDSTGGNEVRSGVIDISPNMLQHWVRSIFGSAGAFYARAAEGAVGLAKDEAVEKRNIPFLRRFYYEPKDFELSHRFYENINSAEVAHYEVQRALEAGEGDKARTLMGEFGRERTMYGDAQNAERHVAILRREAARVRKDKRLQDDQRKAVLEKNDEQVRQTMMQFNKRFEARVER